MKEVEVSSSGVDGAGREDAERSAHAAKQLVPQASESAEPGTVDHPAATGGQLVPVSSAAIAPGQVLPDFVRQMIAVCEENANLKRQL